MRTTMVRDSSSTRTTYVSPSKGREELRTTFTRSPLSRRGGDTAKKTTIVYEGPNYTSTTVIEDTEEAGVNRPSTSYRRYERVIGDVKPEPRQTITFNESLSRRHNTRSIKRISSPSKRVASPTRVVYQGDPNFKSTTVSTRYSPSKTVAHETNIRTSTFRVGGNEEVRRTTTTLIDSPSRNRRSSYKRISTYERTSPAKTTPFESSSSTYTRNQVAKRPVDTYERSVERRNIYPEDGQYYSKRTTVREEDSPGRHVKTTVVREDSSSALRRNRSFRRRDRTPPAHATYTWTCKEISPRHTTSTYSRTIEDVVDKYSAPVQEKYERTYSRRRVSGCQGSALNSTVYSTETREIKTEEQEYRPAYNLPARRRPISDTDSEVVVLRYTSPYLR